MIIMAIIVMIMLVEVATMLKVIQIIKRKRTLTNISKRQTKRHD